MLQLVNNAGFWYLAWSGEKFPKASSLSQAVPHRTTWRINGFAKHISNWECLGWCLAWDEHTKILCFTLRKTSSVRAVKKDRRSLCRVAFVHAGPPGATTSLAQHHQHTSNLIICFCFNLPCFLSFLLISTLSFLDKWVHSINSVFWGPHWNRFGSTSKTSTGHID